MALRHPIFAPCLFLLLLVTSTLAFLPNHYITPVHRDVHRVNNLFMQLQKQTWQWPWEQLLAPKKPPPVKPSVAVETFGAKKAAEELKQAIKKAVARTERGANATSTERLAIMENLVKLEKVNAIETPVAAPEGSATWSILYRSPINLTDQRAIEEGYLYGPFISRLRSLVPQGTFQPKGLFQVVDAKAGSFKNVAEYSFLGSIPGRFAIDGVAEAIPPRRFDVKFTTVELSLGPFNVSFSLERFKPGGWVDITYLDEDFRITRGDKGTIFVTARARSTGSVDTN